MIAVTQTATRYDLSFPDFDPKARETWAAIRDVKALPGRMFDPTEKVWRIPLSASVEVRQLAEKYGAQIEELALADGYSADAAHRIAQLEAQLAAVPRIGDTSPPSRKPSTTVLSLEDMIAAVKAAGYSVTRRKGRAPVTLESLRRKTTTVIGGRTRAKATGKAHGQCVEHWRIDGMQKAICVLGPRRVEGVQLPAQTANEVVGFAEEIVDIAATQGDVLNRLRYQAHAQSELRRIAAKVTA